MPPRARRFSGPPGPRKQQGKWLKSLPFRLPAHLRPLGPQDGREGHSQCGVGPPRSCRWAQGPLGPGPHLPLRPQHMVPRPPLGSPSAPWASGWPRGSAGPPAAAPASRLPAHLRPWLRWLGGSGLISGQKGSLSVLKSSFLTGKPAKKDQKGLKAALFASSSSRGVLPGGPETPLLGARSPHTPLSLGEGSPRPPPQRP